MRSEATLSLVLSVVFVLAGVFSHFYEARSMNMLPVINYPLRPYAVPLILVGVLLAVAALVIQTRKG